MKSFEGIDIKEVWNYRLSSAIPNISRRDGYWYVEVWSKSNHNNGDEKEIAEPLEVFNTGIEHVDNDLYDREKIKVCFEWLYSVREKYSLPGIDIRKPYVAAIEEVKKVQLDLHYAMHDANSRGMHRAVLGYGKEIEKHKKESAAYLKNLEKVMKEDLKRAGYDDH